MSHSDNARRRSSATGVLECYIDTADCQDNDLLGDLLVGQCGQGLRMEALRRLLPFGAQIAADPFAAIASANCTSGSE